MIYLTSAAVKKENEPLYIFVIEEDQRPFKKIFVPNKLERNSGNSLTKNSMGTHIHKGSPVTHLRRAPCEHNYIRLSENALTKGSMGVHLQNAL